MEEMRLKMRIDIPYEFGHVTRNGVIIMRGTAGETTCIVVDHDNVVLFDSLQDRGSDFFSLCIFRSVFQVLLW